MAAENMLSIDFLPQTDYQKMYLKQLIILTSCTFGVERCQQLGAEFLEEWITSAHGEESSLIGFGERSIYYCQAIKVGNVSTWQFLWKKYNNKNESQFNTDILNALGCSPDHKILKKYLEWSISKQDPRILKEDSLKVFVSLSSNELGYTLMKDFLRKNYKKIHIFVSGSSLTLDSFLAKLFEITTKEEDIFLLQNFIQSNGQLLNPDKTALKKSIRKGIGNVLWLKNHEESLLQYFQ